VIDPDAALVHHFSKVPVAQRVSHTPPDADQDHGNRKAPSFEVKHVDSSGGQAPQFPCSPAADR